MSGKQIPTLSGSIDDDSRSQAIRRSLQPTSQAPRIPVHMVRRHSSLGKNRSTNNIKKPSVPDIPEVEKTEEDGTTGATMTPSNGNTPAGENVRISFTKKTRKVSNISRTSKVSVQSAAISERGYVNNGYDQSNISSIHGSMTSLPVIREQYCCCQRWTRLEKNLALIVAILALIIIALVIAIGLVAKHDEETTNANAFGGMVLKF